MKLKKGILILLAGLFLLVTAGALADPFSFAGKTVTLFEGESVKPELIWDQAQTGDGVMTYATGNARLASVDADGTVTAIQKGQTTLTATLKTDKRSWKAQISIRILRPVTRVTVSRKGLTVYDAGDEAVRDLLQEETEYPVLVIAAGKRLTLTTTCEPESASSKKIQYTVTDPAVAEVSGRELRGIRAGECDLVVASEQNPDVTETFHLLVTQPVTSLRIEAGNKKVAVGGTLQLTAEITPRDATMPGVTWSSRNSGTAIVDENGLVTGVKKGRTTIEAKAVDGSGKSASVMLTVEQQAQALSLRETEATVVAGRSVTLTPQILPSDTDDKTVRWYSSDESVATVERGRVTGVKAGSCEITCVSNSNPSLSGTVQLTVTQQVTRVQFDTLNGVTFPVRTSTQLAWTVFPEDATNKALKFTSSSQKVATVDQNGLVTGISRGTATITAAATDGSGRKATLRVNITQPVEGVSIQYGVYHVQIHRYLAVKALLQPSNANNNRMTWSTEDGSVAVVRGEKNVGTVHGLQAGTTTVTGVTEDGGFSASAEIRVADFNGAVMIEQLWVNDANQIRVVLRNMGDFAIDRVYFRVECYDAEGEPIICNADGVSDWFDGEYTMELYPGERSDHSAFVFHNAPIYERLGAILLRVTGWRDLEGYRRYISEEDDQPAEYWTFMSPLTMFNEGQESDFIRDEE